MILLTDISGYDVCYALKCEKLKFNQNVPPAYSIHNSQCQYVKMLILQGFTNVKGLCIVYNAPLFIKLSDPQQTLCWPRHGAPCLYN